ncbi:MAG: tetratricopeptide repeat protein [Armatimonadota bacterium]
MDPKSVKKKKEITFKAGKKPGSFWIIVAWSIVILFSISCVAILVKSNAMTGGEEEASPHEQKVDLNQGNIDYWMGKVSENPEDPVSLSNLAYYYQQAKKYPEAAEYYQRCLKADPGYSFAVKNLGLVYLDLKKYDEAQKLWEDALKKDPDNSSYYLGLCRLYLEKQNYTESIYCAKKAIKIDPGNLNTYEILACIYELKGDRASALKALDDGIEVAKLTNDTRAQMLFEQIKKQIKEGKIKKN